MAKTFQLGQTYTWVYTMEESQQTGMEEAQEVIEPFPKHQVTRNFL